MGVIEKIQEALHLKHHDKPHGDASGSSKKPTVFDHDKVTIIFVLGGPGAGKGTMCDKLVADYGFEHLSAGDLLRAEQKREGSQYGAMIKDYIKEGKVVPSEVTVGLLENAIRDALNKPRPEGAVGWGEGKGRFLVDGFPRQMDQAHIFDDKICLSSFVLFYTCTEEIMLKRLLKRGETSGREDDNVESAKKRFRTFVETSMPVVDYYRTLNKVVEVDATRDVDAVYADTKKAVDAKFEASDAAHAAGKSSQ